MRFDSVKRPQDRLLLSRIEASEYLGISVSLFMQAVQKGELPAPKQIGRRTLWVRAELEAKFLPLQAPTPVVQDDASEWDLA
jgi:excisionase family DNA binding protein